MSMERERWGWKYSFPMFFSLLFVVVSSDFPSQGCYWTETCLHKSQGDCGGLVYNQSRDCYGHCQGAKFSPCQPDHTHFYCCVAGSPRKLKDGCTKCENKVDDGQEFICCSDCTYPEMVYGDSSLGYCQSGADLISQQKPKEVFRWVSAPWLPCSAQCGGGIRSRRVECFAVVEDTSTPDYPVYDDHCSDQEKPHARETCNVEKCIADVIIKSKENKRHGRTSMWVIILTILGVVAIVAGFAGFILYKRRTSNQSGYVYIMMDGFS